MSDSTAVCLFVLIVARTPISDQSWLSFTLLILTESAITPLHSCYSSFSIRLVRLKWHSGKFPLNITWIVELASDATKTEGGSPQSSSKESTSFAACDRLGFKLSSFRRWMLKSKGSNFSWSLRYWLLILPLLELDGSPPLFFRFDYLTDDQCKADIASEDSSITKLFSSSNVSLFSRLTRP